VNKAVRNTFFQNQVSFIHFSSPPLPSHFMLFERAETFFLPCAKVISSFFGAPFCRNVPLWDEGPSPTSFPFPQFGGRFSLWPHRSFLTAVPPPRVSMTLLSFLGPLIVFFLLPLWASSSVFFCDSAAALPPSGGLLFVQLPLYSFQLSTHLWESSLEPCVLFVGRVSLPFPFHSLNVFCDTTGTACPSQVRFGFPRPGSRFPL